MMESIAEFIQDEGTAMLCLIAGLSIRLWVQRRRFYRRGLGGLQHYHTFGKALITTFIERLLVALSVLLLIAATILFIHFKF